MHQNYDNSYQEGSKRISLRGKHLSGRKIKWVSFVVCLLVLLVAALTLTQGAFSRMQGAHAASVKHDVSSKHGVSSKHEVSTKHVIGSSKHASVGGKSKPVLSAAPLSLSFSASSASATSQTPQPQTVTIKNGGTRALYWRTSISPSTVTWITLPTFKTQSLGVRTPSDTPGQLKVYVNAAKLNPGTYTAQITVAGTDQQGQIAGGSSQTVAVTLTVS